MPVFYCASVLLPPPTPHFFIFFCSCVPANGRPRSGNTFLSGSESFIGRERIAFKWTPDKCAETPEKSELER